jgi:hypothetical protein
MTTPYPQDVPPVTPPAAPAPQGSSNRKLFIIIAAVLAVLCLIACAAILLLGRGLGSLVQNSVVEDPQQAAEVGAEIADFTLPSGYKPLGGMELMGVKMAMYGPDSTTSGSMIMLMEIPGVSDINDVNMDQLREQMERQLGRQMNNVRVIDQYETTIRGEPAQVIIQEGTSSEGVETRMLLTVFEGKGGLSMMMIASPTRQWDQDMAADVIKSIR